MHGVFRLPVISDGAFMHFLEDLGLNKEFVKMIFVKKLMLG
jgi:hypothetical protein